MRSVEKRCEPSFVGWPGVCASIVAGKNLLHYVRVDSVQVVATKHADTTIAVTCPEGNGGLVRSSRFEHYVLHAALGEPPLHFLEQGTARATAAMRRADVQRDDVG